MVAGQQRELANYILYHMYIDMIAFQLQEEALTTTSSSLEFLLFEKKHTSFMQPTEFQRGEGKYVFPAAHL